MWALLTLALLKSAHAYAGRFGHLPVEDARDLAAEKASELVARLDSKAWRPADDSAAQVRAFLATVARNAVVDWWRERARVAPAAETLEVASAGDPPPSPEQAVDGGQFAHAIADCASRLSPRGRRVWFLRILFELPTAQIARDPWVSTTPGAVDAILARCRHRVRECLARKGLALGPLPPGTFAQLWELMLASEGLFGSPPKGGDA